MKCATCGNEFTPRDSRQIYCSDICRRTRERRIKNSKRIVTTTRKIPITKTVCSRCSEEYYISMHEYGLYIELCKGTGQEEPRLCPKCGKRIPLDNEAKSFIFEETNLDIDLYDIKRIKARSIPDLCIPSQIFDYDDFRAPIFSKRLTVLPRLVSATQKKENLRLAWN